MAEKKTGKKWDKLKLIVLGHSGIGKTSLIHSFVHRKCKKWQYEQVRTERERERGKIDGGKYTYTYLYITFTVTKITKSNCTFISYTARL